jgi:hypothetical protein
MIIDSISCVTLHCASLMNSLLPLPSQIGGRPENPLLEHSYRQFLMGIFLGYLQSLQVHLTRHFDTSEELAVACEVMHTRVSSLLTTSRITWAFPHIYITTPRLLTQTRVSYLPSRTYLCHALKSMVLSY